MLKLLMREFILSICRKFCGLNIYYSNLLNMYYIYIIYIYNYIYVCMYVCVQSGSSLEDVERKVT